MKQMKHLIGDISLRVRGMILPGSSRRLWIYLVLKRMSYIQAAGKSGYLRPRYLYNTNNKHFQNEFLVDAISHSSLCQAPIYGTRSAPSMTFSYF